jgi:hypothetical protein
MARTVSPNANAAELFAALDAALDVISDLEVDDGVKLKPDQLERVRIAEEAFDNASASDA